MIRTILFLRRRVFSKTKARQHLGNAVFEMALIIAGILIALQINNWNQNRIQRSNMDAYLEIIRHNLSTDLRDLEQIIQHRKQTLLYTEEILGYYRDKHITDSKLFEKGFKSLFVEQRFYPNTSAFESLKASGFLRNLGNTAIEEGIISYYLGVDRLSSQEEIFNTITLPIEENLSGNGFYIEYMDMFQWDHQDTLLFTYEDLMKYPDVQSSFIRSKMMLEYFIDSYSSLRGEAEELITLLDKGVFQE